MTKKVLMLRPGPWDSDYKAYNIQEIGIGKAFCKLGYDYDYVCFNTKPHNPWTFYEYNGCKCQYIEKRRTRFFRWAFNREICSKKFLDQYDYVISREYYQPMTYLLTKHHHNVSMYNGPYWNMFTFKWIEPIYDFFISRKMAKALRCTFVKSGLSKEFLERKGYRNITNVGVGLDMERFDQETRIMAETEQLVQYMTNNKCILYVGHLDSNKNLPFMLKLYEALLLEEPDLKFILIGKSVISPLKRLFGKKHEDYAKEEFEKLSAYAQAGITHIRRVENTQLKYIYPKAKAFVLPSKLEIFGMVLAEAMYLGAPVVTTRNGGSTSLIEGRETGVMIDGYDIDKWKKAILRYLNDQEYTRRVKNNAHRIISQEYTWDAIVKRMIEDIEHT